MKIDNIVVCPVCGKTLSGVEEFSAFSYYKSKNQTPDYYRLMCEECAEKVWRFIESLRKEKNGNNNG